MNRAIDFGRGQAMVELITTYSWVLLIVSIFVAIVFVLSGSPSGIQYTPSSCTIQPLLPCQDTALTNYSYASGGINYYAVFTNQFQESIMFPTSAFNLSTTGVGVNGQAYWLGNCYPTFAAPGATIYCFVDIPDKIESPLGTKVNTLFTVSYYLCNNYAQSSCSTSLYESSGYATQTIAPTSVTFYNVTIGFSNLNGIQSIPINTNGIGYINGVPYPNSEKVIFTTSGNYVLDATIPSGFLVAAIDTSGNVAVSSSNPPLPTEMQLYQTPPPLGKTESVTIVTTNLQCNVCYAYLETEGGPLAPTCPAICPTVTSYSTSSCSTARSFGTYFEC